METLEQIYEWMQLEKENNLILEFANIAPSEHKFGINLGFHVMQPGDKKLKHGPRAKFFAKGHETEFCITISDNPKVVGKWSELVTQSELNKLIANIKRFKVPLLNFWYDSKMYSKDLVDQMDAIRNGKEVTPTYNKRRSNYCKFQSQKLYRS
jgi:hypothetical protein